MSILNNIFKSSLDTNSFQIEYFYDHTFALLYNPDNLNEYLVIIPSPSQFYGYYYKDGKVSFLSSVLYSIMDVDYYRDGIFFCSSSYFSKVFLVSLNNGIVYNFRNNTIFILDSFYGVDTLYAIEPSDNFFNFLKLNTLARDIFCLSNSDNYDISVSSEKELACVNNLMLLDVAKALVLTGNIAYFRKLRIVCNDKFYQFLLTRSSRSSFLKWLTIKFCKNDSLLLSGVPFSDIELQGNLVRFGMSNFFGDYIYLNINSVKDFIQFFPYGKIDNFYYIYSHKYKWSYYSFFMFEDDFSEFFSLLKISNLLSKDISFLTYENSYLNYAISSKEYEIKNVLNCVNKYLNLDDSVSFSSIIHFLSKHRSFKFYFRRFISDMGYSLSDVSSISK